MQRSDDGNDDDDNSRDNNTQPKKRKKIGSNRKMAPQEELKEYVKLANTPKTQAQAQLLAQQLPPQSMILDWTTNAAQSILDWTTKAATASKTPTQQVEVIESTTTPTKILMKRKIENQRRNLRYQQAQFLDLMAPIMKERDNV